MTRYRSGRTYHDDSGWPHLELGPQDDRRYFEQLVKAIFQAGLNWPTIESRWAAFGEVFHDFDPVEVSAMTEQEVSRAAAETRIIRNRRKIGDAVECAAIVNELIARYGSLDAYLRSFGSPEEEIDDLQRRFPGGRLLCVVVHAVGRAAGPADRLTGTATSLASGDGQ